jgi:hypothetical protein
MWNAAILLPMQINPAEEWQRLTEHYHQIGDEELQELAAEFDDLTEMAKQVLRSELRNRGLAEPGAKPHSLATSHSFTEPRFHSSTDPEAGVSRAREFDESGEEDGPKEFTWKTPLCDCDTADQAYQIREMLRRAGIDAWVEEPGSRWSVSTPRVVVAADQLEEAIQVARQPIPQDIIEESKVNVPEFETPTCPKCGAEDPVLEAVDPSNAWLCEACGSQWMDPVADGEGSRLNTARRKQ